MNDGRVVAGRGRAGGVGVAEHRRRGPRGTVAQRPEAQVGRYTAKAYYTPRRRSSRSIARMLA